MTKLRLHWKSRKKRRIKLKLAINKQLKRTTRPNRRQRRPKPPLSEQSLTR